MVKKKYLYHKRKYDKLYLCLIIWSSFNLFVINAKFSFYTLFIHRDDVYLRDINLSLKMDLIFIINRFVLGRPIV